ncbi:MAG: adenylate kinase [Chlamydiae bacterium]|nr:adenylate kinase [Chlamydiota bacterium]
MEKKTSIIPPIEGKFDAILLFGPPGAGKGTLGKFLSSVGSHFHLSSGDIFRGLPIDSPAGKIFHQYALKGNLVPDEVTIEIWHYFVSGLIATNRYYPNEQLLLLDGIPRTLEQAKLLEPYVNVKKIIALDVKDHESLFKRLQKRALVERRQDDLSRNVFETRMNVYLKETAEVLKYYPDSKITHFNGDLKPLEVLRDVLKELTDLMV